MENQEVGEVSAPITESDQVAETENLNETLSEIKEILLESNDSATENNETVQEIPMITEEEFIQLNNNLCVGITSIILVCGIICGSVIALLFKGMFKEE